ncbi:MAG: hypothetical protein LBJ94_03150 [Puniceicoccales bacterium]|jgi:dihydrofolate synthase/folylpolyglutamate synthase|nr:hypothetical protein [Puniceicoccales bacterium]
MLGTDFRQIANELLAKRREAGCTFEEFRIFAGKFLPKNSPSKIIHVAGTNGKGSVCALLESAYRAAGYKTGLFTSPHLLDLRERIQINRQLIGKSDFCRIFLAIKKRERGNLSFFQYLTLIALAYFEECAVEVVILECGVGGRLDSTNIVHSAAAVITSISFDHEEILGDTIEDITREKAGIIKPGMAVFTGNMPVAAETIVAEISKEIGARLVKISGGVRHFESNLEGDFQGKNAKLAHMVLKDLGEILPVSDGAIKRGFATAFWPARNQTVPLKNGSKMILDGAHNWEAIAAQLAHIRRTVHGNSTTLIFTSTKIRQCEPCFAALEPLFHRIFVTNISDVDRKISDALLRQLADKYAPKGRFIDIKSLAKFLARPESAQPTNLADFGSPNRGASNLIEPTNLADFTTISQQIGPIFNSPNGEIASSAAILTPPANEIFFPTGEQSALPHSSTHSTNETYFVTGSLLLIGELASLLISEGALNREYFYYPTKTLQNWR